MFAEIKLLDISEKRPPSFRQALIREVGYVILSSLTLILYFYFASTGRRIREVEANGELRFLGTIIIYASLSWFFVKMLTMLANFKRRALHDYIANTVFVKLFRD
jgi:uncharacterized RDD family membrane protein YckC